MSRLTDEELRFLESPTSYAALYIEQKAAANIRELREYVEHKPKCIYTGGPGGYSCDCGLDAALKQAPLPASPTTSDADDAEPAGAWSCPTCGRDNNPERDTCRWPGQFDGAICGEKRPAAPPVAESEE